MRTVNDVLSSISAEPTVLSTGKREYDGTRFIETVYKTGNYLRYSGVHSGAVVELVPVRAPETIFALLGTALLEGQVAFDGEWTAKRSTTGERTDREGPGDEEGPTAIVGPTDTLEKAAIPAGSTAIGFGDPPTDPAMAYFEREVWSENPFFPETDPDPTRAFLTSGGSIHDFASILEWASNVAQYFDPRDRVAMRAPIGIAGSIVAGVIAPLVAHAMILLPDEADRGTVAISTGTPPEERVVDPESVVPD